MRFYCKTRHTTRDRMQQKKAPAAAAIVDADADENRSRGGGVFVDFNRIAAGRRTAGLQLANHLTVQTHDIGMHVL